METEREMTPILSSLNNQAGVDYWGIETLLARDGGGRELDKGFLAMFRNLAPNMRALALPRNMGPGMARQAGLSEARGDYAMFCDADDTLHSVGVLGAFLEQAAAAPDIVASEWLEEAREGGRFAYLTHAHENTWLHGKMFRRAFLMENGIAFHPGLRVHEDSYFLAVASAYRPKTAWLPFPTYVWRHAPGSITRRDGGAYRFDSMPEFARAIGLSWARAALADPASLPERVCQLACYMYFATQGAAWREGPAAAARREAAERALAAQLGRGYWRAFDSAPAALLAGTYSLERAKSFAGEMERELFADWIGRLREMGAQPRREAPEPDPDALPDAPQAGTRPDAAQADAAQAGAVAESAAPAAGSGAAAKEEGAAPDAGAAAAETAAAKTAPAETAAAGEGKTAWDGGPRACR
jgi:hypothetical protein